MKHDIETVKAELRHELDAHKVANSQALKELELNLKHELETVKTELTRDLKEMEQKLTIKLGAFLAISVTVLAALIKFLQAPPLPPACLTQDQVIPMDQFVFFKFPKQCPDLLA